MQRNCEVDERLEASVPERLSDILPRVVDMIATRHVATSCQLVGITSEDEQHHKVTAHKLAACGYA